MNSLPLSFMDRYCIKFYCLPVVAKSIIETNQFKYFDSLFWLFLISAVFCFFFFFYITAGFFFGRGGGDPI